jgi:hypothetical protein
MFAKKLLYLSDSHLAVWQWRGGKLSQEGEFGNSPESLDDLVKHLAKTPHAPIYLLVDVIEEDFRNETIPHILGKDRQALIQRKLNQLLRGSAYRHASLQGRESEGRRDDKLLMTGLTNEELLAPWVERISKRKLPIAGIYSLPLLSQVLVKRLDLGAPHLLLITRQASGLRQSYFQDGHIKFSRLTLLGPDDMNAMQAAVGREASRTQQYLNSLRLLPRDQVLEVAMLCGERFHPQMESMNNPAMHFRFLPLAEVAAQVGLKAREEELGSELLYLHLLGKFPPPQHYAPPELLWHSKLLRIRSVMLAFTTAVICGMSYVAALNFDKALDDYRQGENLSREAQNLQTQYLAIKNTFPPTPASAEDMQGAVELVEAAYRHDITPQPLLEAISRALEAAPALKINQLQWTVSGNSEGSTSPPPNAKGEAAKPAFELSATRPHQIVILEGEISPFSDYRSALNSIDRFMDTLKKDNRGIRVTPLAMPINVGSLSSLKGSIDRQERAKPIFSMKIVLPPKP